MGKIDRRKNKDRIVGRDSLGRPIWASSLPEEEVVSMMGDAALSDGQAIREEFFSKSSEAAHALARGDKSAYLKAQEEMSRSFYAMKKWEFLVGSMPTRKKKFKGWVDAYKAFREESGFTLDDEKRKSIPVTQRYRDAQITSEAVRVSADNIRKAYKSEIESRNKDTASYDEAMNIMNDGDKKNSQQEDGQKKIPLTPEELAQKREDEERRKREFSELPARIQKAIKKEYDSYRVNKDGKSVQVFVTPGGRKIYGADEDGKFYNKRDEKESRKKKRRNRVKDVISDPSVGIGEMIYQSIAGSVSAFERTTGIDKFGGLRFTMRPHVGPFVINIGRGGLSSISLKAGPARYRIWSRRSASGLSSIDLPGYLSFRGKEKAKK